MMIEKIKNRAAFLSDAVDKLRQEKLIDTRTEEEYVYEKFSEKYGSPEFAGLISDLWNAGNFYDNLPSLLEKEALDNYVSAETQGEIVTGSLSKRLQEVWLNNDTIRIVLQPKESRPYVEFCRMQGHDHMHIKLFEYDTDKKRVINRIPYSDFKKQVTDYYILEYDEYKKNGMLKKDEDINASIKGRVDTEEYALKTDSSEAYAEYDEIADFIDKIADSACKWYDEAYIKPQWKKEMNEILNAK